MIETLCNNGRAYTYQHRISKSATILLPRQPGSFNMAAPKPQLVGMFHLASAVVWETYLRLTSTLYVGCCPHTQRVGQ